MDRATDRPAGGESAVELRRAQEAIERQAQELARSEHRFRSIIDRTEDGIVILSEEMVVLFVNPAAERLFGRSSEELTGEQFGFPVVAGETTEIDVVRPGADSLTAELRVSDTAWEGSPAHLVSLRDITDRKQAEEREQRLIRERAAREQAEASEQRSRFLAEMGTVLDASLDYERTLRSLAAFLVPEMADWVVVDVVEEDQQRRLAATHADPALEPLLDELREHFPPSVDAPHLSSEAIRSGELRHADDFLADEHPELPQEYLELLRALGTCGVVSVPLVARGNTLGAVSLVRQTRAFSPEERALAREIGRRAAYAIDNARLYRAAVAANRAKSDFLAVVSHELRTPLNAVMGYAEILLAGIAGELEDGQEEHVRRINASARHLLQIIEEILSYARMEAGRERIRPEKTTLGELLEDTIAVAEPLARERGLSFETEIEDGDAALFVDAGKIRQILLNLLSNATKFTPDGSVYLRTRLEGDDVLIDVRDTGIGIAPEHRQSIFESFWQVESTSTRQSGGTGLGLSVSRSLARLMGGDIVLESELGEGSRFTLRVPTTMNEAEAEAEAEA